MSIKFICSCGKHLRARDEMAARRSVCPRCGEPVGVPSLQPTHPGTTAAPLTPQERRRLNRDRRTLDSLSEGAILNMPVGVVPAAAATAAPATRPDRRRARRLRNLETHWYQCLLYPFFGRRLLLALTLKLTVLSGCIALLIPELPRFSVMPLKEQLFFSPCLLIPLLALAYTCGSLECALTSALAGQNGVLFWPGGDIGLALKSGLRWLACFLAGPIVLVVIGVSYWLYGGDFIVLDWVMLAELGVLAIGYWLLAVAASNESHRLRDANPLRVAQLVHRLRYRAVVPALVGPLLLLGHLLLGALAVTELHRSPLSGWIQLACCWGSGLFWATFLFRLLGVWCYRIPPPRPQGP